MTLPIGEPLAHPTRLTHCLHVTSAAALPDILRDGLEPRIGPLSVQAETRPGIFLFPSWADLMDANWLFGEAWPHESEPALLAVAVQGVELEPEAGFEVVVRTAIEPSRLTVLAPGELDWDGARQRFLSLGGRDEPLSSQDIAAWLRAEDLL